MIDCLTNNGLDLQTAAADAWAPSAHGALLDACRANPSYQTPTPAAPPAADPPGQTCYLPSGATVWTCGPTGAVGGATPPIACPPPLTGSIVSADNRIGLTINLVGPDGSGSLQVMLDTGGIDTTLPASILDNLGYKPFATVYGTGIVAGAIEQEHLYHVPGAMFSVQDKGVWVPLATGMLTVIGTPHATDYSLGPDILQHGVTFEAGDGQWVLTPACG